VRGREPEHIVIFGTDWSLVRESVQSLDMLSSFALPSSEELPVLVFKHAGSLFVQTLLGATGLFAALDRVTGVQRAVHPALVRPPQELQQEQQDRDDEADPAGDERQDPGVGRDAGERAGVAGTPDMAHPAHSSPVLYAPVEDEGAGYEHGFDYAFPEDDGQGYGHAGAWPPRAGQEEVYDEYFYE
jgi:hypothetical protein